MSPVIKLNQAGSTLNKEKFPFCELVDSHLYLSVCTRANIAQFVGVLARHMTEPALEHWPAAKAASGILQTPVLSDLFIAVLQV
jgi:hypothetical protein